MDPCSLKHDGIEPQMVLEGCEAKGNDLGGEGVSEALSRHGRSRVASAVAQKGKEAETE
jgi:hypothetical protein